MTNPLKTWKDISFKTTLPNVSSQLKYCIWTALGIGVLLRVVQYSLDISLWIDEALISLNIIERSFAELIEPLSYRQGAPYGFLVLEKLAISLFGNSEWALRLVPFIAGLAALYLFQVVARRFSKLSVVAIAMGLFALSDRLIYFSAEVKQYSTDVTFTLLLYVLLVTDCNRSPSWWRYVLIAIMGSLAIWFSHPAVFVLGGIGLTLWVAEIRKRAWKNVCSYGIVFLTWLTSFIAFYWISLRSLTNNDALQESFQESHNAFMPLLPTSTQDVTWYITSFFGYFDSPLGLPLTGLAALCFIAGIYAVWQRDKLNLSLLLSPLLLTLLASGLQQYPFKSRLLLFTVPLALLIIAEGAVFILDSFKPQQKWPKFLLVCLLFLYPAYYAAANLKSPDFITYDSDYQRVREDIKPVLKYVQENRRPGDAVYVYYAAQYAFKYYLERFGFDDLRNDNAVWAKTTDWFEPALPSYPPTLTIGEYARNDWSIFEQEVEALAGNSRVWFIFAHAHDRRSSIDEEDVFLNFISRAGKQLDKVSDVEASACLYDLS